jgi:hypothetical protein
MLIWFRYSLSVVESKGSLLWLKEPPTGRYPDLEESSPHPHFLSLYIHSWTYPRDSILIFVFRSSERHVLPVSGLAHAFYTGLLTYSPRCDNCYNIWVKINEVWNYECWWGLHIDIVLCGNSFFNAVWRSLIQISAKIEVTMTKELFMLWRTSNMYFSSCHWDPGDYEQI